MKIIINANDTITPSFDNIQLQRPNLSTACHSLKVNVNSQSLSSNRYERRANLSLEFQQYSRNIRRKYVRKRLNAQGTDDVGARSDRSKIGNGAPSTLPTV
jgi:hypothetical protein